MLQLNKYESAQREFSLVSSIFFSFQIKLDMKVFVDFCVFTLIWLKLPDWNMKLFWTSKQNNFRFWSGKISHIQVKTQKSINNPMSSFGLVEKNMELSHIYTAVAVNPQ